MILHDSGAALSDCGLYRYRLWRRVGPQARTMAFVMLNPSTADASEDDPTIRRCIGFARREGCGRLEVVNLYAYRATEPKALRIPKDPVGAHNDLHTEMALVMSDLVVFAWGAWAGPHDDRDGKVARMVRAWGHNPRALGLTKSGAPRHPLYLRRDAPLIPYGG